MPRRDWLQNRSDVAKGIIRGALGYDFFEYLQRNLVYMTDFNSAMKISEALPPAASPDYLFTAEL